MRVQQVQLVAAFKSAGKQTPVSDTAVSAEQLAAVPMQEVHTDSFVSGGPGVTQLHCAVPAVLKQSS